MFLYLSSFKVLLYPKLNETLIMKTFFKMAKIAAPLQRKKQTQRIKEKKKEIEEKMKRKLLPVVTVTLSATCS